MNCCCVILVYVLWLDPLGPHDESPTDASSFVKNFVTGLFVCKKSVVCMVCAMHILALVRLSVSYRLNAGRVPHINHGPSGQDQCWAAAAAPAFFKIQNPAL